MYLNVISEPLEFFLYFKFFLSNFQLISALDYYLRYLRYISANLRAAWRVTAELNEIVQYLQRIVLLAFDLQMN